MRPTYVGLRILPTHLDPDETTKRLNITPTKTQRVGDALSPASKRQATIAGWFLSSKGVIESTNALNHLEWLLPQLLPYEQTLKELQAEGCRMEISCYWQSKHGHGGPTLTPLVMEQLARLNLEIWFDLY